jgi:hypothetical protein
VQEELIFTRETMLFRIRFYCCSSSFLCLFHTSFKQNLKLFDRLGCNYGETRLLPISTGLGDSVLNQDSGLSKCLTHRCAILRISFSQALSLIFLRASTTLETSISVFSRCSFLVSVQYSRDGARESLTSSRSSCL